jgi:hypothetical protein
MTLGTLFLHGHSLFLGVRNCVRWLHGHRLVRWLPVEMPSSRQQCVFHRSISDRAAVGPRAANMISGALPPCQINTQIFFWTIENEVRKILLFKRWILGLGFP